MSKVVVEVGWPTGDSIFAPHLPTLRAIDVFCSREFPEDYRTNIVRYTGGWYLSVHGLSRSQVSRVYRFIENHPNTELAWA